MAFNPDRLRNARESMNLKQIQVSERTGINNKTISGYENGVSQPDLETLTKLADIYDVSVDYLLGRTDDKRPLSKIDKQEVNDIKKLLENKELLLDGKIIEEADREFFLTIFKQYSNMKKK